MARTRSPKFEDIQQGILRKAARLFATRGYERTSIGDLVRACDLSRGAIYHYFESKEAILFAMMDSLVRGLLETLTEAAAAEGEPVERLGNIIVAFVEYNARSPDEQVILLNDIGALSRAEQKQIRSIERQVVDLVADAIAAADTRGLVTPRTRKVYTMMLFGMINYTYTWYDAKGPVKPRDLAHMAADLFFNGLQPGGRTAAKPPPLRVAKAARS